MKCANFEKIVLKISKGEENLNKILDTQEMSFNREGIGFNSFNKKNITKTSLLNRLTIKVRLLLLVIIVVKEDIFQLISLLKEKVLVVYKFGYQKVQNHQM